MGTHHTLINGTSYAIKGGTDLIAGTSYQIGGGRTLVNGTTFEVKFGDGLTWIINEAPKIMVFEQAIDFTSNGKTFNYFMIIAGSRPSIVYSYGASDTWYAYYNGSWTQEAFRTVTFAEMPTGALLTWLQANAVQQ